MPIQLLFMGIAAVTGAFGAGTSIKAGVDAATADSINKSANEMIQEAADALNAQRDACGRALGHLGAEKLSVTGGSISRFLDAFKRIKNIDFRDSEGFEELSKLAVKDHEVKEIEGLVDLSGSFVGGLAGGAATGMLVGLGAYGVAHALASSSAGAAASTLGGTVTSNATLAFFGGGSAATSGISTLGGAAVLGGLVAGPALMVVGLVVSDAASKELEKAKSNEAEAKELVAQLSAATLQCEAIRRRTYLFHNLLARLDARFMPLVYMMGEIVKNEGDDYRLYSLESKKAIASCASMAVTIKTVLDTPMLTDDGLLTGESETVAATAAKALE